MQILTDLGELLGFETGNTADIQTASIIPQAVTQATAGASVNMQNQQLATAAIIDVGAISAGLTALQFQVEEWNGTTANGSTWAAIAGQWYGPGGGQTTNPLQVTTSGAYSFLGLRTQGYCRINVVTASGTTVSALVNGRLIGMPRSSGKATGYSRSPSN